MQTGYFRAWSAANETGAIVTLNASSNNPLASRAAATCDFLMSNNTMLRVALSLRGRSTVDPSKVCSNASPRLTLVQQEPGADQPAGYGLVVLPAARLRSRPRSQLPAGTAPSREGVDFGNNAVLVTVIFAGGHHAHRSIACTEDDDDDRQGGGEDSAAGVGMVRLMIRLPFWRGPFPARRWPSCSGLGRGHRAGDAEATALS